MYFKDDSVKIHQTIENVRRFSKTINTNDHDVCIYLSTWGFPS